MTKLEKIKTHCYQVDCGECVYWKSELSWCKNKWVEDLTEHEINDIYNELFGKTEDAVNHPDHYTHGMECIDEMIAVFGVDAVMNFCVCNAWKYRKRALYKNGEQDMEKSDWYMNKFVELKGGKH